MKVEQFSLIQRVLYLLFTLVILVVLYANAAIVQFSHKMRGSLIPVVTLVNPMQYASDAVSRIIHYITDFITLHKQLEQMEHLHLNFVMLADEHDALKKSNELFAEVKRAAPNRRASIIKFLYSTDNDAIKEAFFETHGDKNIKVNSVILQDGCIIGRVYKQDEKYSYVLLHTDDQFRMPVYTVTSRVFGMVYGGKNLRFLVFSGNDEAKVQDGEHITIASSDGIFAEGIDFGTISLSGSTMRVNTSCKGYYAYALAL